MSPRGAVTTAVMAVIYMAFLNLASSVHLPQFPPLFGSRPATAGPDAVAAATGSVSVVPGCLVLRRLWGPRAAAQDDGAAAAQLRAGAEVLVVSASAAITNLVAGGGLLPFSGAVAQAPTTPQVLYVLAVSMAFFVGVLLLLVSFTRSISAALNSYPTTVFLKLTAATLMMVSLPFNLAFMFPAQKID